MTNNNETTAALLTSITGLSGWACDDSDGSGWWIHCSDQQTRSAARAALIAAGIEASESEGNVGHRDEGVLVLWAGTEIQPAAIPVERHPSYRVESAASAADLIARSISHTGIVTADWSPGLAADLLEASDDTVTRPDGDGGETIEFWNSPAEDDENQSTWRVHLTRAEAE